MEFDSKQVEAINLCTDVAQRLCAVTGPAGTGKTRIMKEVYDRLTGAGHQVVCAAPTGKAAKRIQEATGIPAFTVHRLLEYTHPGDPDPKTGKPVGVSGPTRGRLLHKGPIEYNTVLCDEYMMVNTELHRNLLDALPAGGVLRAFGDVNQLKPIEETGASTARAPFQEVLDRFPSVRLDTIHRQGEGSGIVKNGARILKGFFPERTSDFVIITTDAFVNGMGTTRPLDKLRVEVIDAMQNGVSYASLDNQIITPTNKGWIGTYALNQAMQMELMPPDRKLIEVPRHAWVQTKYKIKTQYFGVGDKVVFDKNNYDLKVFNGEAGIITEISEYEEITVDLGDRIVCVPPLLEFQNPRTGEMGTYDPRKNLELAFALTTHKCQGSEYKNVIYVLDKSSFFLQNRHNFYTAITRARTKVTVIADQRSLRTSVTRTGS